MSESALFNPAGGLRYHFRALRYASTVWQPFRWAVGEWLLGWEPPERTLLLVGPSGGYSLQPFLFERFERVVCLEPDPVARLVFRRRLAKAPLERRPAIEFVADDHLVHHPERLGDLVRKLEPCAVLFSNVIGQLRVLLTATSAGNADLSRAREAVQRVLEGRSWASYHDRVSGTLRPEFNQPLVADGRLTDAEVLSVLYASDDSDDSAPAELLDHLTDGFFPITLPHAYFVWELEPSWFHVIEGVRDLRRL